MVEVLSREGIRESILQIFLVIDAVLDDHIRNVVNGLRYSLKLDPSELNGLKQKAIEASLEFLLLGRILRKDQLIHILLNRVYSL